MGQVLARRTEVPTARVVLIKEVFGGIVELGTKPGKSFQFILWGSGLSVVENRAWFEIIVILRHVRVSDV